MKGKKFFSCNLSAIEIDVGCRKVGIFNNKIKYEIRFEFFSHKIDRFDRTGDTIVYGT